MDIFQADPRVLQGRMICSENQRMGIGETDPVGQANNMRYLNSMQSARHHRVRSMMCVINVVQ